MIYLGKESWEYEKGKKMDFSPFLDALLTLKAIAGKEVKRVGSGYNNLDHMDQSF